MLALLHVQAATGLPHKSSSQKPEPLLFSQHPAASLSFRSLSGSCWPHAPLHPLKSGGASFLKIEIIYIFLKIRGLRQRLCIVASEGCANKNPLSVNGGWVSVLRVEFSPRSPVA